MAEKDRIEVHSAEDDIRLKPTAVDEPSSDLVLWWRDLAERDLNETVPKVSEYTAADLEIMGDVLDKWGLAAPGEGTEAACMFYILGKVARAVAAYREGRRPSDDTLKDIRVYGYMIQRIRDHGSWP